MKKVLAVFAFCAISAMAAEWTGYIEDASCAGKKEDHGAAEDHHHRGHEAQAAEEAATPGHDGPASRDHAAQDHAPSRQGSAEEEVTPLPSRERMPRLRGR